jgi:predicted site-specific integrase-resolvase
MASETGIGKLFPDRAETDLVRTGEIAREFGVDPKTVTRWIDAGKMPECIKTPGGHRRYRVRDIRAMAAAALCGRRQASYADGC